MKIILAGGTTGGHISPILSIIPEIKKHNLHISCWIGVTPIEEEIASTQNIAFKKIISAHLRDGLSLRSLLFPILFIISLAQCALIFWEKRPTHVFATGTFFCLPVVIIGKLFFCKVIIHEQTMSIGLANKICSWFADKVLLSSSSSYAHLPKILHYKCYVVGNPIRESLLQNLDITYLMSNLDKPLLDLPIIYITGGSLGRHELHKLVSDSYTELCKFANIIYHRGELEQTNISHENYFEFKDVSLFLGSIYKNSSFAITSCGANTLNELSHFKLPAILLPIEKSRKNEQMENAYNFLKENMGYLVNKNNLRCMVMNLISSKYSFQKNNHIKYDYSYKEANIAQAILSHF